MVPNPVYMVPNPALLVQEQSTSGGAGWAGGAGWVEGEFAEGSQYGADLRASRDRVPNRSASWVYEGERVP
jgi:hypothetical protein